jgi:pimeloyl-ACP methyl ester carboxylesterase
MPYANNNGVKIYYEVEGEGPSLMLAHGATDNLNMWQRRGYREVLANDFRLILFDFRAHGKSDKPHDVSAYGPNMAIKMAGDIIAVLDAIGINKAHYLGYSMGAMIGFRAALHYAKRFNSFILGGITPYRYPEGMAKSNKDMIEEFELLRTNPEGFLKQWERNIGRPLTSEERDRWLTLDTEALTIILTAMIDLPPLTDQDLANISLPCLVYCGDLDPSHNGAKECVSHMPKASFVSLPGLHHGTAFAQSELVIPNIKEFLAEMSKK